VAGSIATVKIFSGCSAATSSIPIPPSVAAITVTRAFLIAGTIALVAIALLLALVLRRIRDVALVLAPLLLAGLLTLATSVVFDLPLNFAHIIALPLLLGIGVAFDIYFVMRWRAGNGEPLQSSTARAILFSALTTGTAFGSLALSNHPGTSEMGKLLTVALFYTLLCTFFVLPALMGPVRREVEAAAEGLPLDERTPGLRTGIRHEVYQRVQTPYLERRDWQWLGLDGDVHTDVTGDEVFPVMFEVAPPARRAEPGGFRRPALGFEAQRP